MKYAGAVAALAAVLMPAAAQAQEGAYAGVGYTNYSLGDFEDVGAVTARLGYRAGAHVGIEGEYSFSIVDGDYQGLDVELDNGLAAFVVGYLPVGERFELIGRVGYASAEVDARGSCGVGCTVTASTEDEGVAYGVGAQFQLSERLAIRGDYTHVEGDFNDAEGFGVSAAYKF